MKLIQITDTHLLADPAQSYRGWNTQKSLDQVLAQVMQRHPDLDALLMTGDLIHDESATGYQRLARRLSALAVPVFAIPGNHDSPDRMQQIFRRYDICTDLRAQLGKWQLLLLSSHQPRQVSGQLSQHALRAMSNALRRSSNPTLLCIHHPACSVQSDWLDSIGLANGNSLATRLQPHAHIKAIISGHVHQDHTGWLGRIPVFTSPSTCRQFLPGASEFAEDSRPPGYRILNLHNDGSLQSRVERLGLTQRNPARAENNPVDNYVDEIHHLHLNEARGTV